ncbi:hypothetical protein NDU88_003079 [Pleurodeles waltl]|uniref:Uncharacterized protein n=1 Tax=Pleurodeles waltl TaxID=8319 RepID=A0AAV7Q8T4_PLEWA|nr:hypothetical protein NDU88_003079 [Pleurodeles waltl]
MQSSTGSNSGRHCSNSESSTPAPYPPSQWTGLCNQATLPWPAGGEECVLWPSELSGLPTSTHPPPATGLMLRSLPDGASAHTQPGGFTRDEMCWVLIAECMAEFCDNNGNGMWGKEWFELCVAVTETPPDQEVSRKCRGTEERGPGAGHCCESWQPSTVESQAPKDNEGRKGKGKFCDQEILAKERGLEDETLFLQAR